MKYNNQMITCLLGDPVDHSVSDVMFQYFAKMTGIKNYKHLKFRVPNKDKGNLKIAIHALVVFKMAGANITLPYKETVIKYLDLIDSTARQMRAVNTIVNKNGRLIGYNTDGVGAIKAIETKLRPIKKSDRVMILGAGGAARAIIAGLSSRTNHLVVLNRNSDLNRATKLQSDFANLKISIEIKPLSDKNIIHTLKASNIIINTTPVGMYPKNNDSLIKKGHIEAILNSGSDIKDKIFFDAVFNPFITDFLKLAKEYGGRICPGIYMMIYQGLEAFKLWTGKAFPKNGVEDVFKLLYDEIQFTYEKQTQSHNN